jgi:hypothetical protein
MPAVFAAGAFAALASVNALLATGPATPEGKVAVRLDAIKYGIHAESLVIPREDSR